MRIPYSAACVLGCLMLACGSPTGGGSGGSSSSGTPHCVPGQQNACQCDTGAAGSQLCNQEGTFDACQCSGGSSSSGSGGSSSSSSTGGGSSSSSSSSTSGGQAPRVDSVQARGTGSGQDNLMWGHPRGWNNWAYPIYDSLHIDATVSDADGLGDISGGYVRMANGQQRVGTFTGSVGSYSASVSWEDITAHQAVNHPTGGTQVVALEVVFLDQASHEGTYLLNVNMTCQDSAACNSVCVSLETDYSNCGSCGHTCSGGTSCNRARCSVSTEVGAARACRGYCTGLGLQCGLLDCNGGDTLTSTACAQYNFDYGADCSYRFVGFGCDEVPPSTLALDCYGTSYTTYFQTMTCTCQQ